MSDSVDDTVLESLKELGGEDDPGLFNELVDVFLVDTPPRIDTMEAAVRDGDCEALMAAAHSLKSSAANMGAVRLSGICKLLESSSRAGESALGDAVESARQEFEAVARILKAART